MQPENLPASGHGLPLLGETLSFARNPKAFVVDRMLRLGPLFSARVLGKTVTFMVGGEALRFVLSSERGRFSSREGWPAGLRELMEGSLMLTDGEAHDRARRLLTRAFTPGALALYMP